jgi:hypothetical protein
VSTLRDVKNFIHLFEDNNALFGVTDVTYEIFYDRVRSIGKTVCVEQKITAKQAKLLPDETILGEWSEAKFTELKRWLELREE